MGTEKGLWCCWCLVLWLSLLLRNGVVSSELDNKSCTSRCGIITNISSPFRLRDDPPHCGRHDYQLECENNVTLLQVQDYYDDDYHYLKNRTHPVVGTYRVLGINYNNFTIRLVDEGIQKGNCSSLPLYSLFLYNFYLSWYPYNYYDYVTESKIVKQVAYLNCSDPVRDDAAYVDTAPCVKAGGHLYAVAGDLLAGQFKPQCRLKSVALVASDWESMVAGGIIKSYADIHTLLSSGFELSWWDGACADRNCPDHTSCDFIPENRSLGCFGSIFSCSSPMGITDAIECGHFSKVRILAEDYLYGMEKGTFQIARQSIDPHHHDTDFNLTIPAIKLGLITAKVVVPYILVRFLFGIIFLSSLLIYTFRRRHLSMYENIEDFIRLHNLLPLRYSYKDLKTMTEGFKTKLGEGGFGTVYKGKLRSGSNVAIKMFGKSKANDCQEFISEVATIGRIHHVNVVHLVGFCVEGTKRALVYEFMPNGSLDKHIFSKRERISLSYHKIYEISLGVARGIAYLHHGCDMQILHFDIKPHNILLDDNFNPKISDFGLVRLYSCDDSIVTLTAARGTIRYMAPELFYKNIGRVSHKADVYSFGMLLMEMASRRRNMNPNAEHSSQLYFPLWIYDQFDDYDKDNEMEDLKEEENDLVKKMFIVALWCIQLKPIDRPSMNKVIEMLEVEDVSSLEMPPKPSLYPNERVLVDDGSNSNQETSTISIHSRISADEITSDGK